MDKSIRIVILLLCVPLLVLGFRSIFMPTEMTMRLGVDPVGANGLNTIRGHLGGSFVAGALLLLIGLWRNNTSWFLAAGVLMFTIALGRMMSFGLDGVDPASLPAFVVELVITGVMVVAHRRFSEGN